MARVPPFTACVFVPAGHVRYLPRGSVVYDVSSYAGFPYCTLSPMWVHGGIPVPGMSHTTSDTVEGVWQGLKVIRGKTAPRYFRGPGQKRGGKPSGHWYGDRLLGIVEARLKIYRPTYEWVLRHRIDPALIERFLAGRRRGVAQHFHDVGDNGDVHNTTEALAHASFLVQFLNRLCAERFG